MSQGTSAPPKSTNLWRRIQEGAAANPAVTAIAVYAVVTIAAIVVAYFEIFSVFAFYDDEGTLLITLKAFVHGHALYRDIWSVYGPFYYELFGGFFKLTGLSITTDASRMIVVLVWAGTSLLFGVGAQRLTGRLGLGVVAMIAAFSDLVVLAGEPMHPEGLCILLLSAFFLVAASGVNGRVTRAGTICGALLGALLLTKVNLGIYAIAAVVFAAAVTIEPLHRRGWLRWLIFAAFLAMPLVVLNRDLNLGWVRELLLLEWLAVGTLMIASRPLWPRRGEDDGGTLRWLLAATVGLVVAVVVILVAILLTGPSPSDLYHGIIKEALEIRDVLTSQFLFPAPTTLDWGIASAAAAFLATRLRRAGVGRGTIWPGLLRAAAGLTILLSVAHIAPLSFGPSASDPVVLPMLLAWVAVIPPAGVAESPYRRLLRVMLPAVAIALTLQVYPVSGSQMGIAAAAFVPIGALCLGDAVTDLRAWSTAREGTSLQNLGLVLGVVTVALPAMFALDVLVLPGANNIVNYHDQERLPLPGAELMRLPTPTVEAYVDVVDLLHEHGCSTFVGLPNVPSLYLWSGLEAPLPTIPNAWPYALSRSQQQMAVRELRASPHPCAFKNEELAAAYLKGLPPPDEPLVNYVEHDFRPIEKVGAFEFMVPKPSATAG
ncbi:MAG TPA: hypothetical protein VH299_06785 [Solirubrobacterales bacterium]|nr:hypothetical protein [Solirubrobacterales bacterium]